MIEDSETGKLHRESICSPHQDCLVDLGLMKLLSVSSSDPSHQQGLHAQGPVVLVCGSQSDDLRADREKLGPRLLASRVCHECDSFSAFEFKAVTCTYVHLPLAICTVLFCFQLKKSELFHIFCNT